MLSRTAPVVLSEGEAEEGALPAYLAAKEYPGLNGLRGISILTVLLSHLLYGRPNIVTDTVSGEWGVLMFFVVSGFLITTLLTKERLRTGTITLRKFYLRRALRIFPVAYLYILVIAILAGFGVASASWRDLVSAGLYVRNLPFLAPDGWLLGHYWSLAVEEQFYVVVPILLVALRVRTFIAYCCVLTMAALACTYLAYHQTPALLSLSSFLFYQVPLAVGSCMALLVCHGKLAIPRLELPATMGLLGVSALLHARWLGLIPDVLRPLLCSIPLAIVVVSSIQHTSGTVYRLLNNKAIVKVGLLSYSLYIWQQAFLGKPVLVFSDSVALSASINLGLLAVVASCSYYLYELPILNWKDRIGH